MADIKAVMMRKAGPMPVWAWTALTAAFIGGFVFFQKGKKPATPTGTTADGTAGPKGEFTSGQSTTTTDANGNQVTSNYNASGPLTGYPGMLTTQAGAMPYSGGDVYVNYPAQPGAPPQQTTNTAPVQGQRLNEKFNMVGWDATAKTAPWLMTVAAPGETWKDITARVFQFGKDFKSVTDPASIARINSVAAFVQQTNAAQTGQTPDQSGPTPGSVVVYR